MELGDSTTAETHQRTLVEGILDKLNDDIAELVTAVETGGLERLEPDQQVAVWQRFERLRNKLPLVDHRLIAQAETSDLAREYCSATMTQFLVRVLQLPHSEAAARVRAAAAVGPRTTMHGEQLAPLLPGLAALQRDGVVSAARYRSWNGPYTHSAGPASTRKPCRRLSSCSPTKHPSWPRQSYTGSPRPSSLPPTPTAQNRSMTNCNTTGAIWS
jgi:hypothetical protein